MDGNPAPAVAAAAAGSTRASAQRRDRGTSQPAPRRTFVNTDRFEGLRRFIRETMAEIRKVIWPDRETTRNLTLVVIAVSVVLGIMLGGIDFLLFQLFEALP
jgi:preprotein translocase subunit SecE